MLKYPYMWLELFLLAIIICFYTASGSEDRLKAATSLDEVQEALAAMQEQTDDGFASLRKFDKALARALAIVQAESEQPRSITWGKLGLMYFERDRAWHQGGIEEALPCIHTAKQITLVNVKKTATDQATAATAAASAAAKLAKPESNTKGSSAAALKQKVAETAEELEMITRGLKFLRYEAFSWALQEGILLTATGKGARALKSYDEALSIVKAMGSAGGDDKNEDKKVKAKVASNGNNAAADDDEEEEDATKRSAVNNATEAFSLKNLKSNALRASVYHHIGDTHLRLLSNPEIASRYLRLSLKLDPCASEAGEGRIRLVHATAAAIAARTEDRAAPHSQGSMEWHMRALDKWQSLAMNLELELHGVGPHNSNVTTDRYIKPLSVRCAPSEGKTFLRNDFNSSRVSAPDTPEKVAQPSQTVPTTTPRAVADAVLREEEENQNPVSGDSGKSSSGAGSLPKEKGEQLSGSAKRLNQRGVRTDRAPSPNAIFDANKRSQPSPSTLLRWALSQVYDHLHTHASSLAASLALNPSTADTAAASTADEAFYRKVALEHRAMSWGYLQQAHEDELWLRYRFNTQSSGPDVQVRPTTNRTLEGPIAQEYRQVYSLAHSVSTAATLKKTFVPGYWPPADVHRRQIGYSAGAAEGFVADPQPWASPIFIVGFFRTGSSLLERMLSAHSLIDSLGEDSVFSLEMRGLEEDMIRIAEASKKHILPDKSSKEQSPDDAQAASAAASASESRAKDSIAAIKYRAASILKKMHARLSHTMAHTGRQPPAPKGVTSVDASIRALDKMLLNYRSIGLIHLLYPEATILHMVRDPMDTLYSCYKNRFADDTSVYTLETESLVLEYKLYLETMAHWRKVLPPVAPVPGLDPSDTSRIVDIQYRDLVVRPEATLKRVLRRLALPWESQVLRYYETSPEATTAAPAFSVAPEDAEMEDYAAEEKEKETQLPPPRTVSYLQVLQPVYTSSLGAWTKYATQLQPLARELAKSLEELHFKHRALPFFNSSAAAAAPLVDTATADQHLLTDPLNWRLDPNYNYSALRDPNWEPPLFTPSVSADKGDAKATPESKSKPRNAASSNRRKSSSKAKPEGVAGEEL